jgi:membrane-associated phospholipid phosphatase
VGDITRVVLIAAAAAVLIDTWRRAKAHTVSSAEERVFRFFNNGPDSAHIPVWAVMQAGSYAAVYVVTAALLLADEDREAGVAFVAGTIAWMGVKELKRFIGRGRPHAHLDDVHVRGQAQNGLGFPSGHSALSLSLAIIATHHASPGLQFAAISIALFTGCARMYVGAHLPLDIAGGFAIGIIIGEVAVAGMLA